MTKGFNSYSYLLATLFLMVTFFVSCQQSEQKKNSGSSFFTQGTSDPGGGNGVENAIYEQYIFDPLKDPIFIKYLKPLFDHIDQMISEHNTHVAAFIENEEEVSLSERQDIPAKMIFPTYWLISQKKWYKIPQHFKKISAQSIGIFVDETTNQQLGLQTKHEIFLSQPAITEAYQNGDREYANEAFAKLMLHEIVMQFYMYNFFDRKELVNLLQTIVFSEFNQEKSKALKETPSNDDKQMLVKLWNRYSPQITDRQTFNESDYSIIRKMTDDLWKKGKTWSLIEYSKKLRSQQFDWMFFSVFYEQLDFLERFNVKIGDVEVHDPMNMKEVSDSIFSSSKNKNWNQSSSKCLMRDKDQAQEKQERAFGEFEPDPVIYKNCSLIANEELGSQGGVKFNLSIFDGDQERQFFHDKEFFGMLCSAGNFESCLQNARVESFSLNGGKIVYSITLTTLNVNKTNERTLGYSGYAASLRYTKNNSGNLVVSTMLFYPISVVSSKIDEICFAQKEDNNPNEPVILFGDLNVKNLDTLGFPFPDSDRHREQCLNPY